jgi:hypothetical protein
MIKPYLYYSAVIILTIALLVYPTNVKLEYAQIGSIDSIIAFPEFLILFISWSSLVILGSFLVSTGKENSRLGYFRVIIFGLVFWGFWARVSPTILTVGDGTLNALFLKSVQSKASFLIGSLNGLEQFPGLSLLLSPTLSVTSISLNSTVYLFLLVRSLALTLAFYGLSKNLLKDISLATLSTLAIIEGSWFLSWANILWPSSLGIIFVSLVAYKITNAERMHSKDVAVVLLFGAAAAITHLVSAFLIIAFFMSGFLLSSFTKKENNAVRFSFISLTLTLQVLTWLTFGVLVLTTVLGNIQSNFSLSSLLYYVSSQANANITNTSGWSNYVRFFWLVVAYLCGMLVAVKHLFKVRQIDYAQLRFVACIVAIVGLTVILTVLSGGNQFYRILYYGSMFSTPLFLGWLAHSSKRYARYAVVFLLVSIEVLALPTFVSYNSKVTITSVQPYELVTGSFLSLGSGPNSTITIFGEPNTLTAILLYDPGAHLVSIANEFSSNTAVVSFSLLNKSLVNLYSTYQATKTSAFVISYRLAIDYAENIGAMQAKALWISSLRYADQGNVVFSTNGILVLIHK